MQLAHVSVTPEARAAVRSQLGTLFTDPPTLDADPDVTPVLPRTGGVPGMWVTAPGAKLEAGVTIYVHGGGFSQKDPAMEQIMAYRLSQATGRPALAVDYRLAPAHPYPAAVEDVVAVHRSLLAQEVPAERILLAGESAGGTLLLSALLALAEAGDPLPGGAVAVSPITDFTVSSPSIRANKGRDLIDPDIIGLIGEQYLAGARPDQGPQSPLYGDLRGLPPLLIVAGGDEVLLDDSRRFAEAASAAGVDTALDVYDGMPHAFHAVVLFPGDAHLPTATTFLRRLADWTARLPVT
ncbi:alpha/beta hydrolase [Nonomuraea sp. B5E05]|uniref:alpha/beta hydrolase n=1 Tax=Nonomuraea sp. B5E05 TaxID=3153569 RepID=UPI0032614419